MFRFMRRSSRIVKKNGIRAIVRAQVAKDFDTSFDIIQLNSQEHAVIAVNQNNQRWFLAYSVDGIFLVCIMSKKITKTGNIRLAKINVFPRTRAGAASPRLMPANLCKASLFPLINFILVTAIDRTSNDALFGATNRSLSYQLKYVLTGHTAKDTPGNLFAGRT